MFENIQTESKKIDFDYMEKARKFLGNRELFDLVGIEEVDKIIEEVKGMDFNENYELANGLENNVVYNRRNNAFLINNEKVTPGEIVASSNFDYKINFPGSFDAGFEAKRLKKNYEENRITEVFTKKLNKILAIKLSEKSKREDLFKSNAYAEIAKREEDGNNEQLGMLAEKLMYSFAQMIAIDKSNLKIEVEPANAYQDVEEKIDFTIKTHTKIRGVGAEVGEIKFEDKSYGIQFTINSNKIEHKQEQIAKSKERSTDVDDILLVTLDSNLLMKAKTDWEKDGKKIRGIFAYLPKETRIKTVENLFKNILNEEDIKSLVKSYE